MLLPRAFRSLYVSSPQPCPGILFCPFAGFRCALVAGFASPLQFEIFSRLSISVGKSRPDFDNVREPGLGWPIGRVCKFDYKRPSFSRTQLHLFRCQLLTLSEHNYPASRLLRLSSYGLIAKGTIGYRLDSFGCHMFSILYQTTAIWRWLQAALYPGTFSTNSIRSLHAHIYIHDSG